MKSILKKSAGYVYVFVTTIILVIVFAKNSDMGKLWHTIISLKAQWIAVIFTAITLFFVFDTLILHYLMAEQGVKIKFLSTLKIVCIGLYYSCLTPSSSGGQPMQVYYLKKQGVSIGSSSSALAMKVICYQLVTVVFSIISFALYKNYVYDNIGKAVPLIILGNVINSVPVVLLLILAINKKFLIKMMTGLILFLKKIHIIKNSDELILKLKTAAEEYCDYFALIKKNPKILINAILMTAAEALLLMIIVCFVYKAFALKGVSLALVLALQFMLNTSVSFAPMPGASGVQELGFFYYFKYIFPNANIYSALMLWRFFTYYFTILVGAIVIIFDSFSVMAAKKREIKTNDKINV